MSAEPHTLTTSYCRGIAGNVRNTCENASDRKPRQRNSDLPSLRYQDERTREQWQGQLNRDTTYMVEKQDCTCMPSRVGFKQHSVSSAL